MTKSFLRHVAQTARVSWPRALGELTIVTVGVLLALWANEWKDRRRERAVEREYVQALVADFESDAAELRQALELSERFAAAARLLLGALRSPTPPDLSPAEFLRSLEFAGFLYFPAYSRYTFDDLMSTGNLRLIEDRGIKRRVATYYANVTRTSQWQENWRTIQRRYEQWVPALLSLRHREAITLEQNPATFWLAKPEQRPPPIEASAEEVREVLEALRRVPDVEPALNDMVWVQGRHHQNLAQLRQEAIEITGTLRKHLTGR